MDCAARTNPNLLFAETVVDALVCAGLRAVCLAPGSRSTPLALAVDAHPGIETFIHLDERSAGFFALGLAQATARPVALLSTSGTAAVEFHAAAVEALMAGNPAPPPDRRPAAGAAPQRGQPDDRPDQDVRRSRPLERGCRPAAKRTARRCPA